MYTYNFYCGNKTQRNWLGLCVLPSSEKMAVFCSMLIMSTIFWFQINNISKYKMALFKFVFVVRVPIKQKTCEKVNHPKNKDFFDDEFLSFAEQKLEFPVKTPSTERFFSVNIDALVNVRRNHHCFYENKQQQKTGLTQLGHTHAYFILF
eukprot:GEMP01095195.1.p1 GENE.GEMP01095195.1~~GEMP01095195.1.p1  ORF type:complete len:150 (-),score=0.22 GEMP01095195.1:88-537(-)